MALGLAQGCSVCEPKQKVTRPKRPVSLAGLAARVSHLEACQWTADNEQATRLAVTVPSLVEATSAATSRLAEMQRADSANLDEKLAAFGHRVKVTLAAMQQQRAEEAHTSATSAAEDARSSTASLRDLHDRQALLEGRLAALMQDQAVRTVKAGAPASPNPAAPANAAAEAAAAAAKKALSAAEAAEVAASAASRSLETVLARQQKALEEADARERRLTQQIQALTDALADQGRAHAEVQRALAARVDALEHASQRSERDAREARLALRNVAIQAGLTPPQAASIDYNRDGKKYAHENGE